jgi:diaminopimelate epimerase
MKDPVRFTKMSGAGNDFMVLDARTWEAIPGDRIAWTRAVCRRGLAVGADGVLVVSAEQPGQVRVLFLNPDGAEAFCGNGSRCAARYAVTRGLAPASELVLLTAAGRVPAVVEGAVVTLTLPAPVDLGPIDLSHDGKTYAARWVDAGVPHIVLQVQGIEGFPLERIGPPLRRHPALGPAGANVDIVELDAQGRVHVRTWERGVENETLACGTGAVAVALDARLQGGGRTIVVVPRSGSELTVTLPEAGRPEVARLTGDARFVFEGTLDGEATLSDM